MNYFMTNAISNPIKYLTLSGGDYGNISRYKSGISRVLKMITHEIYLMAFEIDDQSLKTIFEASHEIPRLVLCNCKISLPKEFTLEKKIDYKIQELDLYETFRKSEESFLVPKKMNVLISAMSLTTLKKSLTKIHVKETECINADGTYGNLNT